MGTTGLFPTSLSLLFFSAPTLSYLFSSPHALPSSANLRAERSADLGPVGQDRGRRPRRPEDYCHTQPKQPLTLSVLLQFPRLSASLNCVKSQ